MVCGQIQAAATLIIYLLTPWIANFKPACIFEGSSVCFSAEQPTHCLLKETYRLELLGLIPEASFTLPSIAVTGTSTNDDGLIIWIFFLCTPLCKERHILTYFTRLLIMVAVTETVGHKIYQYQKGLSTNCMYMIKYQSFSKANLTFQFGFWSIRERRYKNNINRMHNLPTW
jgi:hypothetical protein